MSLQKGLVAHWTMSQDSLQSATVLADKTPYENKGTIYGATFTTDRKGQANKAMLFDGVDDYIDCGGGGSSLDISNGLTMTAWINSNDVNKSTHQTVFGKNNQSGGAVYAHQIDASTNGIFSAYFRQLSPYPLVKSNTYLKVIFGIL